MDRFEPTDGVDFDVKRRKAAICRKRRMPAEAVSNSWGFENNDRSCTATKPRQIRPQSRHVCINYQQLLCWNLQIFVVQIRWHVR